MHARKLALLGFPLAFAMTAVPVGSVTSQDRNQGGGTVRGPDAHIVGPWKSDFIDVQPASPRDGAATSYVAPDARWRFVRVSPGHRLRAGFFATRYHVADPDGLAAARGNRRWVRYGPDLLLVDIRTGRVLRVVPNRYA